MRGPPVAHPPFPHRRIQPGRAELVPPAPSPWGTRPAPLTPRAAPGTGSCWQRGRRRATAAAEPACRGEPSRGDGEPSPALARGPVLTLPSRPAGFTALEGRGSPGAAACPAPLLPAAPRGAQVGARAGGVAPGLGVMEELVPALAPGTPHGICPPWDGARCPAGMWQLRTPLLMTQVASASLVQGSWGNGI